MRDEDNSAACYYVCAYAGTEVVSGSVYKYYAILLGCSLCVESVSMARIRENCWVSSKVWDIFLGHKTFF